MAKQLLDRHGMSVQAYTVALGGIKAKQRDFDQIEQNRLFCPDNAAAERMEERIREVRSQGDTLGGLSKFEHAARSVLVNRFLISLMRNWLVP
ncbi:Chorismate synthase [Candidatus Electrothrix aarhusensis]|uniref:chorismate synthase n=1 Tax=Candidatus Electrothrix aarhusensis TaxID=1859131 RepID=A0A444IQT2_9BACT|nr:Chorismate synthase [Candidatus Electrothrix aarhusensis]